MALPSVEVRTIAEYGGLYEGLKTKEATATGGGGGRFLPSQVVERLVRATFMTKRSQ